MANTNITQIFFLWKPKSGKSAYSIFIHHDTLFTINIHIGANDIQNPNPMKWISQQS